MHPRDYIVPLVVLGAIAGMAACQGTDARRDAAQNAAATRTSSSSAQAGDSLPASGQPLDPPSPAAPAELVTVQSSRERAPTVDTARVRDLLREGSAGTYLATQLAQMNNAVIRWPDRRTAMRVWIERDAPFPDWDPQYPLVAERAFEEWQEAGFPLRFDMILDPREVDIHIRWIEKFPAEDGRKIGVARIVRDQHGWLVSAEISIATHDSLGRPLPPHTVAGTTRHEIGHALGLGHSGDPGDVMNAESITFGISAADRKRLRLLYMLPPGRMP